jgi:hypothetical protein
VILAAVNGVAGRGEFVHLTDDSTALIGVERSTRTVQPGI